MRVKMCGKEKKGEGGDMRIRIRMKSGRRIWMRRLRKCIRRTPRMRRRRKRTRRGGDERGKGRGRGGAAKTKARERARPPKALSLKPRSRRPPPVPRWLRPSLRFIGPPTAARCELAYYVYITYTACVRDCLCMDVNAVVIIWCGVCGIYAALHGWLFLYLFMLFGMFLSVRFILNVCVYACMRVRLCMCVCA